MDSSREGGWDIDDKRMLEMMYHRTQQGRTGNRKDRKSQGQSWIQPGAKRIGRLINLERSERIGEPDI